MMLGLAGFGIFQSLEHQGGCESNRLFKRLLNGSQGQGKEFPQGRAFLADN